MGKLTVGETIPEASTMYSHVPVIETIFALFDIQTVLEFGMGFGSTPFFVKHSKHVTSIEMNSGEWYTKMCTELKEYDNFIPVLCLGEFEYKKLALREWYDFVFVDGHGDSRWSVINDMFEKTNLMVAHDTETTTYKWDQVKLPSGWKWIDLKFANTWSSIIMKVA